MRVLTARRSAVLLVAVLFVAGTTLLAIRQPFSVVYPVPELRSFDLLPTAISFAAFQAGPIEAGNVVDQEVRLSADDVAVRMWLGPAQNGVATRTRIELLASPRGPSLRSGVLDLPRGSGPVVARIVPPLRPPEIGENGTVLLRIAPVEHSQPIRVGMAQGKSYRPGRAFIGGELLPDDQDVMFEVARELSPGDVWSYVWTLIRGETFAVRAAAAASPIILVAGLAFCAAARGQRGRTALLTLLVALVAAALVVVDRTTLSLFPGPGFDPDLVIR